MEHSDRNIGTASGDTDKNGGSYSCFATDQAFGFHHSITRSLAAQNATRSGRGWWWVQLVHIMTEENSSCFTPALSVPSAGFSSLAQPAHTILTEDSHILTVSPAMQRDSSSLKWGFNTSGAFFKSMWADRASRNADVSVRPPKATSPQ